MHQRYFQPEQWLGAGRNALKPRILLTMALTVLSAVVIYGIFQPDRELTLAAILSGFVGGVGALFVLLFGLTTLAHQLHCQLNAERVPNVIEACRFAWEKARSILTLPLWGAGVLLALVAAELLVLSLANIPALGLLWLALIGVPLLLLNTVVAVALMLALFNMAAHVAIADADATTIKESLWRLIKERLPELLVYNLGGVLVTIFMALLLLSPLWLGAQVTLALVDYAAQEPLVRSVDAIGFWGSIAHLVGLIMVGLLLAAVASIPGVVITQMTLLVHLGLAAEQVDKETVGAMAEEGQGETESIEAETAKSESPKAVRKPVRKRTARKKKEAQPDAAPEDKSSPDADR